MSNLHPMHLGGAFSFPFGRVKMTIAHHGSGLPDGSYGGNPAGFLINFNEGFDLYISGDTALTYDMKLIGESGGVDLAILCAGDNFTMGPEDAIMAAQFVKAKHVIPVHYNTWPLIESMRCLCKKTGEEKQKLIARSCSPAKQRSFNRL